MHSRADNAEDIRAALERGLGLTVDGALVSPERAVPVRDLVLIGYSKGPRTRRRCSWITLSLCHGCAPWSAGVARWAVPTSPTTYRL
jgi:hypothetical protein